jgi:hypothetical protein
MTQDNISSTYSVFRMAEPEVRVGVFVHRAYEVDGNGGRVRPPYALNRKALRTSLNDGNAMVYKSIVA